MNYRYTHLNRSMFIFEKVRIAMCVAWWWSFMSLKFAQLMHYCFSMFLLLPDSLIGRIAGYKPLYNTYKEKVEILSAQIDSVSGANQRSTLDITNKFKVFLRFFWEEATQKTIHDSAGFDAKLFFKMFNATVLNCRYALIDKERIEHCISVLNDHMVGIIARRDAESSESHVAFGHIHFDEPDLVRETNIHLNALLNDANLEEESL